MNTVPLQIEAELARLNVLRMVRAGGSGHLGGALSCIDIVTALYFATMRVNPQAPKDPNRDRFLLSAGHKAMAQYAVLGRRGYFEEALFDTYGSVGSKLGGHPDLHKLPGIEANTGALGHGLSIAAGMALGLRAASNGGRVFTVLGDGELPEGANWEGASIASHHRLDNLVAFVDVNNLQISGPTAEVMNMEPIADKFAAFGWNTVTIDGTVFTADTSRTAGNNDFDISGSDIADATSLVAALNDAWSVPSGLAAMLGLGRALGETLAVAMVLSVSVGATLVTYCIWAFEVREVSGSSWPFYELSIVPMLTALLRYTLVLEQGHGSAPEEIFAADRWLQAMGVVWVIVFGLGVYVG